MSINIGTNGYFILDIYLKSYVDNFRLSTRAGHCFLLLPSLSICVNSYVYLIHTEDVELNGIFFTPATGTLAQHFYLLPLRALFFCFYMLIFSVEIMKVLK